MADNKRGRGDRDENQENRNECKSAKAIKLLREVTSLLSEGDSEPYQPAAEQISQAHGQVGASGIVQNFRKLFAPYSVHNSTPLSSSRQAKKNYPKPKLFQPKETWTHEFFCLAAKDQSRAPTRAAKFALQQAGLGRRKICFHNKAKLAEFRQKLEEAFPKLCEGGGFEIMRTGHQGSNSSLTTITPPASGYSVPFLRDSSGLGQALAYIRPLQRDLDSNPVFEVTFLLPIVVVIDIAWKSLFF